MVSCSAPCCRRAYELRGLQISQWRDMRADPQPLLLYCPSCRAGRRGIRAGVWRYYQVTEQPGMKSWHAGGIPLVGVDGQGLGVSLNPRVPKETVGCLDEPRVARETGTRETQTGRKGTRPDGIEPMQESGLEQTGKIGQAVPGGQTESRWQEQSGRECSTEVQKARGDARGKERGSEQELGDGRSAEKAAMKLGEGDGRLERSIAKQLGGLWKQLGEMWKQLGAWLA